MSVGYTLYIYDNETLDYIDRYHMPYARTDNGALRRARSILRSTPLVKGTYARLEWGRDSDGCTGVIARWEHHGDQED